MSDTLSGQCLCGAVKVKAKPARPSLSVCHCDMCRAWSSSMFLGFEAESDSLEVSGPVRTFVSSDWAERAFCETCGSNLWYRLTMDGPLKGQTQLAAGLFTDAAGLTPKLELYIDKKPHGYALEGKRRTMTEAEVIEAYAPKDEGDSQ